MCILQLLVGCIECSAGALLSDEAVCEVVHSCFRISSQALPRPAQTPTSDLPLSLITLVPFLDR